MFVCYNNHKEHSKAHAFYRKALYKMERFKEILKKLFILPPLPTVIIAVPSFVFVFVMLSMGEDGTLAYIAYILSAYAMIITVTGFSKIVRTARRGFYELPLIKKIRSNPLGDRLLEDAVFRSELSLHGGLAVNILYAALNLFSGIRYQSAWFIALAFYYAFLSAMRAMLVAHIHHTAIGKDIPSELRRYRSCGIVLLLMNQALAGIVIYIVNQNKGFEYPGLLIYAMAMYTFYITITAIVNVIRFRKHGSPVLSAAKIINLTAALVSMLSLETAMLAQFDSGRPGFRRIMTAASGGGVCIIVLGMAIYMIFRSSKQLKQFRAGSTQT